MANLTTFKTGLVHVASTYALRIYNGPGRNVLIKASISNTGLVFLGRNDVVLDGGFELAPGEAVSIEFLSPSQIFVIGTVGDSVSYIVTS